MIAPTKFDFVMFAARKLALRRLHSLKLQPIKVAYSKLASTAEQWLKSHPRMFA